MAVRGSMLVMAIALLPQAAQARPLNPCDFDGDRKSDQTILRPDSSGTLIDWWVRLSGGGIQHFSWGTNFDWLLCADIDGDGRTDATAYRPQSGTFWSRLSAGGIRVQSWGGALDDPSLIGDYDGDGRDDFTIYRRDPSGSTYWILQSTGTVRVEAWGGPNDDPQVLPDYDGDGRTDLGVQRDNLYFRKVSSGGVDTVLWGDPFANHQSADYDGDGRTDIAVLRPINGSMQWWIRSSVFGQPVVPYGNGFFFGHDEDDVFATADFDGDGRTDVAVWRRPTGAWWIQGTAAGLTIVAWGAPGDSPVQLHYWH